MTTEFDPIPECWYHHLDKGQVFFIVALDQEQALIEIQYFDGNLEEIELSQWYEMNLEPAEQPEDWAGPMDISEPDDFGTSITDTSPEEWDSASQDSYGDAEGLATPAPVAEQDDWREDLAEEEPLESDQPLQAPPE
jgi:hypothetical protein